jgi:hypothetical protein
VYIQSYPEFENVVDHYVIQGVARKVCFDISDYVTAPWYGLILEAVIANNRNLCRNDKIVNPKAWSLPTSGGTLSQHKGDLQCLEGYWACYLESQTVWTTRLQRCQERKFLWNDGRMSTRQWYFESWSSSILVLMGSCCMVRHEILGSQQCFRILEFCWCCEPLRRRLRVCIIL